MRLPPRWSRPVAPPPLSPVVLHVPRQTEDDTGPELPASIDTDDPDFRATQEAFLRLVEGERLR